MKKDEKNDWSDHREKRREKKQQNLKSSLAVLRSKGIKYETLNEGNGHCRIGDWDFWPTTGKFLNIKTKEAGRGVFSLLKKI